VRHKLLPRVPAKPPTMSEADPGVATLKDGASRNLLMQRGDGSKRLVPARSASPITRSSDHQSASDTFRVMLSAAFGCKTSETALALLEQVMEMEHPASTMEPERINAYLRSLSQ
jgi:hypothetical protein